MTSSSAIQKLINLYVTKIKKNLITIEEVPVIWREEVKRKLEADL